MNLMTDLFFILFLGFFASRVSMRLGLPGLIGMIATGIVLGPELADLLSPSIYAISDEVRLLALLIILLKAGLGLDKGKILTQGTVALRLAFLPVVFEASVVTISTRLLFGWEWLYCWLLGWIICAASPAVIVPLMLRLKSEGWGTDKGIPDLILAEATVSDATAITMFGITLMWLTDGTSNVILQLLGIPMQIGGGLVVGYLAGKAVRYLLQETSLTSTSMQDAIVALSFGLLIISGSNYLAYSDYLGVMTMGFILLEIDGVVARKIRKESTNLWALAEILLFVLIGATVDLTTLSSVGLFALIIVGIGVFAGKWLGVLVSTLGSRLLLRERLFMVVGGMAKATVQAAIAGIPLAMGLPYGNEILAISVVAILFTAPIGAFGTSYLAPRLLTKGEVDPTKVMVKQDVHLLVAVDGSPAAKSALKKATSVARDTNAFVTILYVVAADDLTGVYRSMADTDHFVQTYRDIVADIPHEFLVIRGTPAQTIVEVSVRLEADYIYMGKANRRGLNRILVGDTADAVINHSEIPVILVDEGNGLGAIPDETT